MYKSGNSEIIKKLKKIDESFIEDQKKQSLKNPIRGGSTKKNNIDLNDIPEGVTFAGPMKGLPAKGYGVSLKDPVVKSVKQTGGKKKELSNKTLWKEINKAIDHESESDEEEDEKPKKGGAGSVVESQGQDLEDLTAKFKKGGAFHDSGMLTPENLLKIEKVAENTHLLNPILDKAPTTKKGKIKAILHGVSSILKDISPIVRLVLELRKSGKGMSGGNAEVGGAKFPDKTMQELPGNYTGGAKKKAPTAWNDFVKKIMKKTGKGMKDTLKYIKSNNLWKK